MPLKRLEISTGVILLLTLNASAYVLSFYADTACSTTSRWDHFVTNDTTYQTPCETIPTAVGRGILSAKITSEALDDYWGYTAQLFTDAACSIPVVPASVTTDEGCKRIGAVGSFIVTGIDSDFTMPEGPYEAYSYTVNTVNSIGGDAVTNETQSYMSENYGDGSSGSSVSYDSSGSSGSSSPVIYPIDDANFAEAISNDAEAGIPGDADEIAADAECDDVVQTKEYAVDSDGDGFGDGMLIEEATVNPENQVVKYKKTQLGFGQNDPTTPMTGPVVNRNPTENDPLEPDPVLDYGSSGTSTSSGWPAVVPGRM